MLDYNVKLHTNELPDLLEIGAAWGRGDQQLPCQGTRGQISMQHEKGRCASCPPPLGPLGPLHSTLG